MAMNKKKWQGHDRNSIKKYKAEYMNVVLFILNLGKYILQRERKKDVAVSVTQTLRIFLPTILQY